jgi:hypothetical protein
MVFRDNSTLISQFIDD